MCACPGGWLPAGRTRFGKRVDGSGRRDGQENEGNPASQVGSVLEVSLGAKASCKGRYRRAQDFAVWCCVRGSVGRESGISEGAAEAAVVSLPWFEDQIG